MPFPADTNAAKCDESSMLHIDGTLNIINNTDVFIERYLVRAVHIRALSKLLVLLVQLSMEVWKWIIKAAHLESSSLCSSYLSCAVVKVWAFFFPHFFLNLQFLSFFQKKTLNLGKAHCVMTLNLPKDSFKTDLNVKSSLGGRRLIRSLLPLHIEAPRNPTD